LERMNFKIRQVRFVDHPGIKTIRQKVFIEEQSVPEELEWDGEDDNAIHVIAADHDNNIIGTARILVNGHIGRMAVAKSWRHQGVGTALLNKLLKIAIHEKMQRVFLNAQTSAVDFYRRFGFERHGEEFMDAGIPHYFMEKNLGQTRKNK